MKKNEAKAMVRRGFPSVEDTELDAMNYNELRRLATEVAAEDGLRWSQKDQGWVPVEEKS